MINNLDILDNIVLLAYFGIVLLIGLFPNKNKIRNTEDYFLAGRNLGWLAVGFSIFATNISSEHFVGLATAGANGGFSVSQFEWMAVFILIFLGWILAPILIRSKVLTLPQFLGERFNKKIRIYLASISIAAYFITKVAVSVLTAGYLFNQILNINTFSASILVILLTGIYTVVGGLRSVVNTQIFQAVLLVISALALSFFGFIEIGGFDTFIAKTPTEYFDLFKPISDPHFPWLGILLGAPILGIWYWCTDQYIVQRIFAAKNVKEARKGITLTGVLKFIPIFFMIIPGLIALILYPETNKSNVLGNLLTGSLLPAGIKGMVYVGIIAALMSSLSSVFNSAAALFTNDIYKPLKSNAKETELLLVGRLSSTIMVFLTIGMIPLIKHMSSDIYLNLQELQAYISPPITAIFLIGIFKKTTNNKAAFNTLIIGALLGFFRIILPMLDLSNTFLAPLITQYTSLNYLKFAVMLFIISNVVYFTLSKINDQAIINSKVDTHTFSIKEFQFNVGTKESAYCRSTNIYAIMSLIGFTTMIIVWELMV